MRGVKGWKTQRPAGSLDGGVIDKTKKYHCLINSLAGVNKKGRGGGKRKPTFSGACSEAAHSHHSLAALIREVTSTARNKAPRNIGHVGK